MNLDIYIYPDSSYYHLIFLSFFLKKQQICPAFAKLSQIKKGQGDERIRDCTSCATIQNKRGAQKEEDGILALGPKCHAKSISIYPVAPNFWSFSLHLWKRNFQASNLQMNETISFYIISRFFHGDSWTWNVHDDGRAFGIGINTLFLCSVTSLQKWLMLKRKRNTTLFFMALDKEIVHAIYN